MKKLFTLALIGAFSTITLTSCANSDMTEPTEKIETVKQQNENFKASAREVSESEEAELIAEAIFIVTEYRERPETAERTTARSQAKILCNTNLSAPRGHACVWNSSGHLVNVTWGPKQYTVGGAVGFYPDWTVYEGHVVSQCNC